MLMQALTPWGSPMPYVIDVNPQRKFHEHLDEIILSTLILYGIDTYEHDDETLCCMYEQTLADFFMRKPGVEKLIKSSSLIWREKGGPAYHK